MDGVRLKHRLFFAHRHTVIRSAVYSYFRSRPSTFYEGGNIGLPVARDKQ